jgi:hypothetical protein
VDQIVELRREAVDRRERSRVAGIGAEDVREHRDDDQRQRDRREERVERDGLREKRSAIVRELHAGGANDRDEPAKAISHR